MTDVDGSADAGNPEPSAAGVTVTPGDTPAAPTPSWIDGITDTDTRSWAESKGLQNGSFENVIGSYRNLEKLMGADRAGRTIHLLGDDSTDEQRNEFYGKLGRPDEASGYGLTVPEGGDPAFSEWAAGMFHKAGLSKAQGAAIQAEWEAYLYSQQNHAAEQAEIHRRDATADLQREWGAAYDQNMKNLGVYAGQLGLTDDELVGLRNTMGPVAASKFVIKLGGALGDDIVDLGEADRSGIMTPDQAQQALGELNMNKEFMEAWLNKTNPGHKAAVEKKAGLARLASGIAA